MKTTIELSDDVLRRAKAHAALTGRKLKDLVEEGLRRVIEAPVESRPGLSVADLLMDSFGIINSGIPDLATNPAHLEGFGQDSMGRGSKRHR